MQQRKFYYIREFLAPLWAFPKMTSIRMLISFTTASAFVINTELFRRLISVVENGKGMHEILVFVLAIIGVTTFSFSLTVVCWKWHWAYLYMNYWRYLTDKYLRRYLLLDNEETLKLGTGKTISIMERAFDGWLDSLTEHGVDGFEQVVRYILGIVLIAYIQPRLVIPLILLTVGFGVFTYWVNNKILVLRIQRNAAQTDITGRMVRVIMEKFTILKNGKINSEIASMNPFFARAEKYGLKVDRYFVWSDFFPQFIIDIGRVVTVGFMAYQTIGTTISMADFAVVLLITGFLSEYALSITKKYQNITREATYVWRLIDTFDAIPSIKGYDEGNDFVFKKGEIVLENIQFAYKKSQNVFDDFSLKIDGGKKIAIVGTSGAGKTTFIKLILGFIRPQSGNIFIDGQDITTISLKSYYRSIGYLPQEPAVFDGTVYENLTYGLLDGVEADERAVKQALQSAQCEFVERLPEGLQTEIGEKGIRLSGGERQRLAIARLFLQNPEIIILDEPTASLDSFSEAKISEALHILCKGKTFIVIAHRLQTVKEADEIFVLENGNIIEHGSHTALITENGRYAEMVKLQSGIRG